MIETQVLMRVSDFSGVFLGIISWKIGFIFQRGGVFFRWGRASFSSGVGERPMGEASVLIGGGGFEKNRRMGRAMGGGGEGIPPTKGNHLFI